MVTALFPGSFDPMTNGHADLIARAASIVDRLVVAVGYNSSKEGWLTVDERVEILEAAVRDLRLTTVVVGSFQGLATDYAREVGATILVKGMRNAADWQPEYVQAVTNREISGIDTLFLPSSPQWSALSSSIVRELVHFGAPTKSFVPPAVERALHRNRP